MNKLVIVGLIILILSACGPSEADIQKAIQSTQAAMPTSTPIPTLIPTPTSEAAWEAEYLSKQKRWQVEFENKLSELIHLLNIFNSYGDQAAVNEYEAVGQEAVNICSKMGNEPSPKIYSEYTNNILGACEETALATSLSAEALLYKDPDKMNESAVHFENAARFMDLATSYLK